MPQQKDKKYNLIFYIFVFILLSTINNYYLAKNKDSFLKIKHIKVEGLEISLNSEIRKNLNFLVGKNIFYLDVKNLKKKLSNFSYIENYRVSKLFPSILKVELTKTKFLAETYKEDKKYFIGLNKKLIFLPDQIQSNDLPIVYGKFSIEEFFKLRKNMLENKFNISSITHYYYFPSKRWDVKLIDGTLVKLPIENINSAINKLTKIIQENINASNKTIDLRVSNQIIFING